jgi:hypothetical protein
MVFPLLSGPCACLVVAVATGVESPKAPAGCEAGRGWVVLLELAHVLARRVHGCASLRTPVPARLNVGQQPALLRALERETRDAACTNRRCEAVPRVRVLAGARPWPSHRTGATRPVPEMTLMPLG